MKFIEPLIISSYKPRIIMIPLLESFALVNMEANHVK